MIDPAERDWQEAIHDNEPCVCSICGHEGYYHQFVAETVDELFEMYEAGQIELESLDYRAHMVSSGATHICPQCGADEYPIYLNDS